MPTTAASVGTSSGRKGTEACLYLSSQTELTQTAINKTAHQTETKRLLARDEQSVNVRTLL